MSAMLQKVVVRSVGVLKAFDTPNAPRLAKLTTIYARNGRGKTTLSSVLRAAAAGNSNAVIGRRTFGSTDDSVQIALVFDSGTMNFSRGKWSQPSAPIEVFDTSFIAENLFAGESVDLAHDRSLFGIILGRDGVKLARHQDYFNACAKRAASRLKEAEAALNNDIPSDQTMEEFFASLPSVDIDDQILEAQKALKGIQQAERLSRLKKLETLQPPRLDAGVELVLETTLQDIEASARSQLAAHFTRFRLGRQGEAWVKFGLDHIHDDNCPFCGRPEVDEQGLVTLYSKIFGQSYQTHFDLIKTAAAQVEATIGRDAIAAYAKTISTNSEAVFSWSEFVTLDTGRLHSIERAIEQVSLAGRALTKLFETKRETPLSRVFEPEIVAQAKSWLSEAVAGMAQYNDIINEFRNQVAERQSETRTTEQQAALRHANLVKRKRRTDPGVQSRIDNLMRAKRQDDRAKRVRSEVQGRLKKANADAAAHYYDKVNDFLEKFEATFRISPFTNSMAGNAGAIDYGLIVRGHQVPRRGDAPEDVASFKNTLSTGDKTTLAFAFFLAGLERLANLASHVVVIDDPLSSHDTHRQSKTVEILKNLCDRCAQVIVLSHDEHFLRQVTRRCSATPQVCYKIIGEGADNWSKADVVNLDELCRSNHALQIDKLKAFYDRREGDAADIAPYVRRVLETHYRGAYSAYFDPDDNLGPMIRRIRDHGVRHPCWDHLEKLDACDVGTRDEHHGDDPTIVSSTPVDTDDLRATVRECLELINARRPSSSQMTAAA